VPSGPSSAGALTAALQAFVAAPSVRRVPGPRGDGPGAARPVAGIRPERVGHGQWSSNSVVICAAQCRADLGVKNVWLFIEVMITGLRLIATRQCPRACCPESVACQMLTAMGLKALLVDFSHDRRFGSILDVRCKFCAYGFRPAPGGYLMLC
jgi:hypothetical protein